MILETVTPTADRTLLAIEEMRAAAGVTGSGQDSALITLSIEVADSLSRACGISAAGVTPPTLRSEALRQTMRQVWCTEYIRLERRPVVSVESVTVDGGALDPENYEIDVAAGKLYRLQDDCRVPWSGRKIVVEFTAGWATVPGDLKQAAKKLVTALWSDGGRDPDLKRERTDFGELEYWVPPTTDPLLSAEIQDLLRPYVERGL